MKQVVVHGLGYDTARKVADAAIAAYTERYPQYQPKARWTTDKRADVTFTVKGITLEGWVEVGASEITMDLDVPFLLRPFKGTAIKIIEDEIERWIKKAKAGEI